MNRPTHFEITSDDPSSAVEFYSKALGWKISKWDGPVEYWLVSTGEEGSRGINGAIVDRTNMQQPVVNTIEVASLDETISSIESCGGAKVAGPMEIPGVGSHAYCIDPQGTLFGILQPLVIK
ncbi:MAG: VOC family protein [Gammaproteobacteria bacterium]|nr:VOC family protein [Gammaproteobacteria bacterium]MDH5691960.1 VOC family protein [Gammaproteobacteria bacterium]